MLEMNPDLMAANPAAQAVSAGLENKRVDPAKLAEASQQFEAVFLKQFIGQALKPVLHDTPGSQVAGAGVYQHMVTDVIADNLASSGDFGFSSMLQAQLADPAQPEDKK